MISWQCYLGRLAKNSVGLFHGGRWCGWIFILILFHGGSCFTCNVFVVLYIVGTFLDLFECSIYCFCSCNLFFSSAILLYVATYIRLSYLMSFFIFPASNVALSRVHAHKLFP